MGRVLTSNIGFAFAPEASRGVLPASPTWKKLEPNRISDWGATIATVRREPISQERQRRKGTIVDLDAAVAYDADLTIDSARDFAEGFVKAVGKGGTIFSPASVDGSGNYTIVATSQPYTFAESLMFARGFDKAVNSGLKVVDSVTAAVAAAGTLTFAGNPSDGDTVTIGSTVYTFETGALDAPYKVDVGADAAASIVNLVHAINGTGTPGTHYATGTSAHPSVTAVDGAGDTVVVTAVTAGSAANATATTEAGSNTSWGNATLTGGSDLIINVEESTEAETLAAADNATLELCGYRGATGDLQINSDGDLIATTLNFTTLGLTVGQGIWIGGTATANKFATAANYGMARIEAIAAGKITLNKRDGAFSTDAGTGKNVHIYFGKFFRNVGRDHADWSDLSYQFEGAIPGLGDADETLYEYAKGNSCDQWTIDLPLTDKATITCSFYGQDVEEITASRKTNAASALEPVATEAFNTSTDIARIRVQDVDESGLTTDFKSLRVTINNNVSPEKVLGYLGSKHVNTGFLAVDIAATLLFTNADVVARIRDNDTVTLDFVVKNDDGGIYFDMPALTLGDGARDYPTNESVRINLSGTAHKDPILGTSLGLTIFPYLPAS